MVLRYVPFGLATVALTLHLGHGYGKAIDVFCTKEVRTLPRCGFGDEGRISGPPLASVLTVSASTSSSSQVVISGGTFYDTVTDDERTIPPKVSPWMFKLG
jgi:hypothetical protein